MNFCFEWYDKKSLISIVIKGDTKLELNVEVDGKFIDYPDYIINEIYGTNACEKFITEFITLKFPKKKDYIGEQGDFNWQFVLGENSYKGLNIEPQFIKKVKKVLHFQDIYNLAIKKFELFKAKCFFSPQGVYHKALIDEVVEKIIELPENAEFTITEFLAGKDIDIPTKENYAKRIANKIKDYATTNYTLKSYFSALIFKRNNNKKGVSFADDKQTSNDNNSISKMILKVNVRDIGIFNDDYDEYNYELKFYKNKKFDDVISFIVEEFDDNAGYIKIKILKPIEISKVETLFLNQPTLIEKDFDGDNTKITFELVSSDELTK